jgi:hypothetical protein
MSTPIRKACANNLTTRSTPINRPPSDTTTIPSKRIRVQEEKKGKNRKTKTDDQITFSDEQGQEEDSEDDGIIGKARRARES